MIEKPAVSIKGLTVAYQANPVLWNIDLEIPQGILMAVVGPNGAGKSTLIKAIQNMVKPLVGAVSFWGTSYKLQQKRIAYVPQRGSVDWDFPINVMDVVLMGRYGHLGWFKRPKSVDLDFARQALAKVGLADLATRHISHLSGGQQQRVFLARALVQDADLYLMDEPFQGVDAQTEKVIIDLLKELRSRNKTVVVVHHDLHTVKTYFDWVTFIKGQVVASGPISQTFTQDNLAKTYGANFIE